MIFCNTNILSKLFSLFQEEDATLSAEDLQKKIERLTKLSRKKSEDFTFVNNTLRASDLGQDRFRLVSSTVLGDSSC